MATSFHSRSSSSSTASNDRRLATMKLLTAAFLLACCALQTSAAKKGKPAPVMDMDEFQEKMKKLDAQIAVQLNTTEVKNEVDKRLEEISEAKAAIKSIDGSPVADDADTYEGPYAKEYFEGDILLTREQLDSIVAATGNGTRSRRQAQKNAWYPSNIWKDMAIPYSFDRNLQSSKIAPIREAIKFWEANTCIRFRENGSGRARLRFINGNGCYSMIGKTGYEQVVSIGYGCDWIGTIAHELAHAFGIWHTQTRFDRGNYVQVNAWNVLGNQMHNFNTQPQASTDLYGLPYEFGSVMHYYENDFARNRNQPTLVARKGYERFQHSMSGYLPTSYDIHLVNSYYQCYDKCRTKMTCQNGGRQDVNNCSRCKCPAGFSGTYCESISTSGCDKYYSIGPNPTTISATAGRNGLWSITYTECNIHLKPSTAGRRLEITVTTGAGYSSWNCYGAGVDVRVSTDPAMSGIRFCRPNTRFAPVFSDGDRAVLKLFSRVNYVDFTFSVRSIVS